MNLKIVYTWIYFVAAFLLWAEGGVLFAAENEGDPEARKEFEAVFGSEFSAAKNQADPEISRDLARRYVDLVRNGSLNPEYQVILLRKSFELSSAHVVGADVAVDAFDLLVDRIPDEQLLAAWKNRLAMRRAHFEASRRDERNESGQAYLDDLLMAANLFLVSEPGTVAEWCEQARRLVARIETDDEARLKVLTAQVKLVLSAYRQWDRLLARLHDKPDDLGVRKQAVILAVVSLNRPDWAFRQLTPEVEAALRDPVALLARGQRGATPGEAYALGEWLETHIPSAPLYAKCHLIGSALSAYRRFRALQDDNGMAAAKADLAIARLEERLAEAEMALAGHGAEAGKSSDRLVNLLALFSSDSHSVQGQWTREKTFVTCDSSVDARIMLPAGVSGSYALETKFKTGVVGGTTVFLIFPVGDRQAAITFDSFQNTLSGLELIRGKRINEPESGGGVARGRQLQNNREYRCVVTVTLKRKDVAVVTCEVDRKRVFTWEGPVRDLSAPAYTELPDSRSFGLGAFNSSVTWKSATLRLFKGSRLIPLK